jgi:hypothetical protein
VVEALPRTPHGEQVLGGRAGRRSCLRIPTALPNNPWQAEPVGFLETVGQARAFLERNGRISLRALEREFDLDPAILEQLIEELVEDQRIAVVDGRVLAWSGEVTTPAGGTLPGGDAEGDGEPKSTLEGERKQVTVFWG